MATTTATGRNRARSGGSLAAVVLVVAGLAQLLPGLLAFLAPGASSDAIAGFPPRNDHVLRDLGAWQIGLGAIALAGARRPAWHAPLLGLLALQYALHAVSHVIDVNDSDPAWQGPVTLALQVLGALLLAALALRERTAR